MSKSAVLLLALIFLTAFCLALTPAFSSEPIKENSWTPKSSMQVARSGLGVAVVNGRIYALGGVADDGVVGPSLPGLRLFRSQQVGHRVAQLVGNLHGLHQAGITSVHHQPVQVIRVPGPLGVRLDGP